jgi:hypothetical protein
MDALLAQATPSAQTTFLVLISIVSISSGLATVGLWWQGRHREIEPQPLQITKVSPPANSQLCDSRHAEISRRLDEHDREIDLLWRTTRSELLDVERRLNVANEVRTEKVHERINQILEAVSELRGEMKKL